MITGRCECATWGEVSRDEFTYLSGEDHLKVYSFSDRPDSVFCDNCGSTVLVDFKTTVNMLYITMGTVDNDLKRPPGFHQFVGSKAPWFEICDDLPQYDGCPDEE